MELKNRLQDKIATVDIDLAVGPEVVVATIKGDPDRVNEEAERYLKKWPEKKYATHVFLENEIGGIKTVLIRRYSEQR